MSDESDHGVSNGLDIWKIALRTVATVMQVMVCIVIGYVAGRKGYLTRELNKKVNILVANVLTPCFLFSRMGPMISSESLMGWWPLPMTIFASVALGCPMGYLLGRLCGLHPGKTRLMAVLIGFKNTLVLPVALAAPMAELGFPGLLPEGDTVADATTRVFAYILFGSSFQNICNWTLAYRLLEPPNRNGTFAQLRHQHLPLSQVSSIELPPVKGDEEAEEEVGDESASSSTMPDDVGVLEDDNATNAWVDKIDRFGLRQKWAALSTSWQLWLLRHPKTHRVIFEVGRVFNAPLTVALLAIFVGLVPPLKNLFFGKDAPLAFFTLALETMGAGTIPISILTLGSSLSFKYDSTPDGSSEKLGNVPTSVGLFLGLIIMPLLGIATMFLFIAISPLGVLRVDPAMQLAVLFMFLTPPNIGTLNFVSLHQYQEYATARYVLIAYALSVATMTACSVLNIHMMQSVPDLFPLAMTP